MTKPKPIDQMTPEECILEAAMMEQSCGCKGDEMKQLMDDFRKGFLCGTAYVCAELCRRFDLPTTAQELMKDVGTLKEFKEAGVDKHDLKELQGLKYK